ncbi:MAG TPA: cytochrome c biogenesis protein CcdA [Thermoanaerobaculia bacterium]|nr:cytochrome c biogenesis protein CcdA [Thermoanaerobaculia bacterium]
MKSRVVAAVLAALIGSAAALAQEPPLPLPGLDPLPGEGIPRDADLVGLTIAVGEGGREAGDLVRGTVLVDIAESWHVNSATPTDDFAIPTVLELDSGGIEIAKIEYPPHVERTFEFAGGDLLAVYEGEIGISFEGTRTLSGVVALVARLKYQACNDRICLPPRVATASVEIGADGVAVVTTPIDTDIGETSAGEGFTRLEDAPAGGGLFSDDLGSTLESRGLVLTLLVVFVLGLALNLTPCVYPLIPLTVAYFSSQTVGSTARRFGLASSYVLGLAAMYSALGVFSALSGQLFGAWLQLPQVLVFFAALMVVLASSMFGVFEIRVPHFIADRAGARAGYAGAATMGLLAGIVAAPCVGPFIISLIALVGQKASVGFGFLLFFVLALGLGFPYLILGVFSTAVSSIPRSGAWMVLIKQALGFVLIAMAFFFLRPLTGDEVYRWGVGLSLLFGAGFLLLRRWSGTPGAVAVRAVCGAMLLTGGLFFLWPRPAAPGVEWTAYEGAALERARLAGRPVMIDFYADWCLPCKELDEKTFTSAAVIAEGDRFVRLKADLTRTGDERVLELTDEYEILGVPTIVFLDRSGREVSSARLTGFERPGPFLERMKQVR